MDPTLKRNLIKEPDIPPRRKMWFRYAGSHLFWRRWGNIRKSCKGKEKEMKKR